MPAPWADTVRWYRRASRGCAVRTALAPTIATWLEALRAIDRPEELRARYVAAASAWGYGLPPDAIPAAAAPADVRRAEEAAFGLRWLELAAGRRVEPRRSLVPQLPLRLLSAPSIGGEASLGQDQ
jgi:hypothetical protein